MMRKVKIIECPRDAMQGIKSHFIPTEKKALYINSLLKVGFDTIDFGSFVSPKAIPQMRDTEARSSFLVYGVSLLGIVNVNIENLKLWQVFKTKKISLKWIVLNQL